MSSGGVLPLYGTTVGGGSSNDGTVYELYANHAFTVLHSFTSGSGGCSPESRLVLGGNGTLYGTTDGCGQDFAGTLFSISSGGVFQVLHTFGANASDLAGPGRASPMLASNGKLYGTAGFHCRRQLP